MSGGSAPANTTTTTTINQSPWQNATYRALALGTPGNLGPVAQQLKIGQQLTNDWMDIQSGRNPGLYYGMPNATPEQLAAAQATRDVGFAAGRAPVPGAEAAPAEAPTQQAAEGGIMSLQGYADGGTPKVKKLNAGQVNVVTRYNNLVAQGEPVPESLINQINNIENRTGRNVSPFVGSGTAAVANQALQASINRAATSGNYPTNITGTAPNASIASAFPKSPAGQAATTASQQGKGPFSYSDLATPTAFLDPKTGQNMLADAQLAYQKARELGTPEQIQQATDAYSSALKGMQSVANYTPQQVQAAQAAAAQMSRGTVRDINAIQADVEKYRAANMEVPPDLQAEQYQAAQMQGAQMQGPQSWNAPGTVQQYMDPYMQSVVDQSKFEANRQAAQQQNKLRSQATQQKAFGGSRAALQEAEANRNLGYMLEDIQNKGMSQAYQQGLQQFNTAQGQGLQAGQANLQANLTTQQQNQAATNAQRQMYVQQALDAAKTNYGGAMTAAQQNMVAQNAAQQFNAQSQNQAYNNYAQQQLAAQQANQGMDWNVGNLNTSNQQQTNIQNAQLAQQAALANQQAGLQANQQNIGAYGAMGNMAQGLGGLGATQSQINLNNLAALGQSATAQTQFAQGALDRNTQNAINYYNLPSTFNAPGINALNAQPVSGGTSGSNTAYGQAKWFNKGGKVQWGPKK